MSSSQPFLSSSQLSPGQTRKRKSRFTYRHLTALSQSSTNCPLRVIAHIDLDAFYAQCEGVRLGIDESQPLAVQQWQGLIAINYPARKFGLNRHITITEAKKLCPELLVQHVATWKEGDDKWAYHADAFANIATHKVSLDPYRLESRRILACIKDCLPPTPIQRVEKASVDEVFLDLSAQIHAILLERYPELQGPPPYDDPTECLPRPPTTALDWNTDALVDLDDIETEDDDPDWDDVVILLGSEVVRQVRAAIREKLKYTCSAGIARNKMIAKLGSAHKKPNQQTIVRNRAIQQFLGGFKFTKIRNLGGKLGDEVVAKFATDEVKELLGTSIETLKSKLGDETGSWVYHIIRGDDSSEVNARTQIKSMLSAKSFRPAINTPDQAIRWLRIFVADIYSRLVEEGLLEHKRKPRTLNLHHRQGAQMRSKSITIPSGRTPDESVLFDLARNLLGQIVIDGRAWPCINLQLSVGGFEDGPTGNKGIGNFLVRGEEAKALNMNSSNNLHKRSSSPREPDQEPRASEPDKSSSKRIKASGSAIPLFFSRRTSSHDSQPDPDRFEIRDELGKLDDEEIKEHKPQGNASGDALQRGQPPDQTNEDYHASEAWTCDRCNVQIPISAQEEHGDWHFAKDLQAQERQVSMNSSGNGERTNTGPSKSMKASKASSSRFGIHDKTDKGQQKLAFG